MAFIRILLYFVWFSIVFICALIYADNTNDIEVMVEKEEDKKEKVLEMTV